MVSWALWAAGKAGWYFFAWGPQLLICLYLGYLCAKKTSGDLVNWLVAAFLASLVPLAGVVVMLAVWWRAGAVGMPLSEAGAGSSPVPPGVELPAPEGRAPVARDEAGAPSGADAAPDAGAPSDAGAGPAPGAAP